MTQFFETERLLLRPLILADAETIFQYVDDELTKHWIDWEKSESLEIEEARVESILDKVQKGLAAQFIAIDKTTDEFIGLCGFDADNNNPEEKEIDVWVKRESQRKGYALEMVKGLISWVKQQNVTSYLIYSVTEGNTGSKAIAEKLNLKPFRTFNAVKRGVERNVIDYKIILK